MYKITAFRNAQEFQELFGIQEHGNGVKSRRNKILLQFYKSKSMWDYCNEDKTGWRFDEFFSIRNMAVLKDRITEEIIAELYREARDSHEPAWPVNLMNRTYWSHVYSTDESNGIPSNGDVGAVRYITHEKNRNGKAYRMRAGRFYKRLLLESKLGRALPEQVLNWLCEQFTEQWSSYVVRRLPHFTLHVDDDFRRIYNYDWLGDGVYGCTYDFNSCMMGDDQWVFYRECVKAKAAYLENDDGRIIARCVIFTDVRDEDGNVWRLAERQYAEEGRDLYKRCLVDALVDGGYIDGYKQVGVDCHSTTSYVDKDGNSLMDKKFHIECDLEFSRDCDEAWDADSNHILSYQDSFKFYDFKKRIAYNTEPSDNLNILMLDTTSCYLEGKYDDYHGYWCSSTYYVWVKGREMLCDINNLSDFINFEGNYIHKDDFMKCPICGNLMPDVKYYRGYGFMLHFRQTDTYVCSEACLDKVREDYEENVCFKDDVFCEYVNRSEDTPLYLLHLCFGKARVIKCRASNINNFISQSVVKIYNNILDGESVPVLVAGVFDPNKRVQVYMADIRDQVILAAAQVVAKNKNNDVEQLYLKNEVTCE